jgi:hypothetical protein
MVDRRSSKNGDHLGCVQSDNSKPHVEKHRHNAADSKRPREDEVLPAPGDVAQRCPSHQEDLEHAQAE